MLIETIHHNYLPGYVANQHIDWTGTTESLLTTGLGDFGDLRVNEGAAYSIDIAVPNGKGISLVGSQATAAIAERFFMQSGAGGDNASGSGFTGGDFEFISGDGGDGGTNSVITGGSGGAFLFSSGNGGIAGNGVNARVGGPGGEFVFETGDGGGPGTGAGAVFANNGGSGGRMEFRGGMGADSELASGSANEGGNGADFEFYGGHGGAAHNGTTNNGGEGGSMIFTCGTGGTKSGTGTFGEGGSITFIGGNSSGTGGDVHFTSGLGNLVGPTHGKIDFKVGTIGSSIAEFPSDATGLNLFDGKKLYMGSGRDLEIYYNNINGNSIIDGNINNTGGLVLQDNGTTRIELNATGLGFFGATPVAKPAGVAVTATGIHTALVSLGLIAA